MPKFSIITTTYKHEKYIRETIESILSQSFSDWELLIGDDSPDDSTWDIIQEYMQKYPNKIKAWHHSPNKWIVENANFLLSQISESSEYIAFLEWDDVYVSDCLQKKYEIFERYQNVWLIYSDMDFINWESQITLGGLLKSKNIKFFQNELIPSEEYIASKNPLIVSYSSVAIRKNILPQFLPIQSLTTSKTYAVSDYDLFFRISSVFHVFWINESLTRYRRHSNNLSANYVWLFDDLQLLIEKYKRENLISYKTYTQKKSWIWILKSISKLSTGEKSDAWDFLKKANKGSLFSDIIYKFAIVGFICLPSFFTRKILSKIIRRGS